MPDLNSLPLEILRDILSHLDAAIIELHDCSLSCKKLSGLANAEMYKSINLNHHSDNWRAVAKTVRRQERLLRTLAENPELGALVRTFKTAELPIRRSRGDMKLKLDDSVYVEAAKNMNLLTKAYLTPNPISAHILANLGSYPQLEHLETEELKLEDYIWSSSSTTALTSLKWTILFDWRDKRPAFKHASFLLKVAETTCPNLQSLDVVLKENRDYGTAPSLSTDDPPRAESYDSLNMGERNPLKDLRHFGFHYEYENALVEWELLLGAVERYKGSLKSVSTPINSHDRQTLDFLLKVAELLPGLKSFTITGNQGAFCPEMETVMTGHKFFDGLTQGFVERGVELENFEVWNMQECFGEKMGILFRRWKGLKVVRLGDNNDEDGEFGDDGRLDFFKYRPHILKFVKCLPPTLEQLTLEINASDLFCDRNEYFEPVTNLGPEIFTCLPRLHSFDIHAWTMNGDGDGCVGPLPENAVFYRRLPFSSPDPSSGSGHQLHDPRIRELCISRMACIYQEDEVVATELFQTLKLDSGDRKSVV